MTNTVTIPWMTPKWSVKILCLNLILRFNALYTYKV